MASKSGTAIRDFFISLGFDASEVDKGFKKIERDFAKLNQQNLKASVANQKILQESLKTEQQKVKLKTEGARLAAAEERANQARVRTAKAIENSERKSLDFASRREAAMAKINRVSRRGDWMIRRQGGASPLLSGTAESNRYNEQLNDVRKMASTATTSADFRRLNSAMADLNLTYNQLIVKNRELQRQFTTTGFTAKALQDSLRNLARSYVSVFAVIGGSGMAAATGQDLVSLRTTLLAATGSAEEAGKAFEFVKSQALGMGLDLQSSVKGFAQMGVAAKMAGFTAEQTQEIFTGLAEASAAFGMSTVDQERAQRAIVQMMS